MPVIDFSEVKDLEPIPQGSYLAEIVHAAEGLSKSSGEPKIDLRWKILEGDYADRQVFDTLAFHPKALFRVKATLKALGFSDNFSGEVSGSDLIGLQATIVVSIDEGGTSPEGEAYPVRNRVVKVKPASASIGSLLS